GLWVDKSIRPGSVWREQIAEAIADSREMGVFISPRFFESSHCVRELNFALEENKPVLIVYVNQVDPPSWFRMTFGERQALYRHALSRHE
ncbi:MAG: toll/interleukin-1 receptor domain-containing protein, partial [Gammaproteobacteria bacterium]|nr:toll/interleukin-1 receptor domain-containing protein [Gammaproteobacteria bacterium]